MPDFSISIANMVIGVSPLHPSVRSFFKDYLTTEKPDFTVAAAPEQIDFERKQSFRRDREEGQPARHYGDAYLETLAILRQIADRAIERDAVLMHGCAVVLDKKAYLFAAPSGTGKTTHANLWLRLFPDAYILNGDKPFLCVRENRVFVCGTPWMGKEHFGKNEIMPLEAVCFIEQARENEIKPLSAAEALEPLLRQVHKPSGSDGLLKLFGVCCKIERNVRLFRLRCNREPDAALVSSGALIKR